MVNDTTRLLGLDGLVADRVELHPGGSPVVHLSTGVDQARCCPQCGIRASRVKGWVLTRPRDLPVGGRATRLRWRKRRWHCDQPGCPRRTFTEQVAQVPARARITVRLRQAAGAAVADANHTVVQTARDLGLSWPVVAAAFTAYAGKVLPAEPEPVAVLGIDEVRRGKPCWSFDEVTASWTTTVDRWHVGFVDLIGGQGLLAQVEGRTSTAVTDWLTQRPTAWREQVQAVAIDMCTVFKAAVRDSDLLELHRLATTIETWWPEILAFLHTGITNAGSEGTNRVIKTVARDAYGFRNPENQRLRTRTATTRRHRGHLNPA